MRHLLVVCPLFFASTVISAVHNVESGVAGDFKPDSLSNVERGDTIAVTFYPWAGADYTLVQSTFDSPCQYMKDGIYAGSIIRYGHVFSFVVNSTEPLWFYDHNGHGQAASCQNGKILSINPSEEQSIDAYRAAAAATVTVKDHSFPIAATGGTWKEAKDSDVSAGTTDASSASATSGAVDPSGSTVDSATASSAASGSTAFGSLMGIPSLASIFAGCIFFGL